MLLNIFFVISQAIFMFFAMVVFCPPFADKVLFYLRKKRGINMKTDKTVLEKLKVKQL